MPLSDSEMLESLTNAIRRWEDQVGTILTTSDEHTIPKLVHLRAEMSQILVSVDRIRKRQPSPPPQAT